MSEHKPPDLVAAFVAAATEVFPIINAKIDSRDHQDWLGSTAITTANFLEHGSFRACLQVIENYPGLGDELAQPEEGQRFVYHEGSSAEMLASHLNATFNILTHAAIVAQWSVRGLTLEHYVEQVRRFATELAVWAADKSSPFTAIQAIGLYNVWMNAGEQIELKDGLLLPSPHTPGMPMTVQNSLITVTVGMTDWNKVPATMFVQERQNRVSVTKPPEGTKPRPIFSVPNDQVIDPVAFAIVMAGGHHDHSAPQVGTSAVSHPLIGGGGSRSQPFGFHKPPGIPLPATLTESLQDYYSKIIKLNRDSSIRFAGRRLVSSFNSALNEDALVDAVVVWEAIFSTTPETTFLVTASVARTLLPTFDDGEPALQLQGRLAKIYQARSNIVHGNATKVRKERASQYDYSRNAKRYSFRLLRAVLNWPAAIQNMENSKRSKQAILDPHWPSF